MKTKENEVSGFSLVEAMIAMTILLVILGGVFSAFKSLSDVNVASLQAFDRSHNLQTGLNLIRRDLQRGTSIIPNEGLPLVGNDWGGANRCIINSGNAVACPNPLPAGDTVILLPKGTSAAGRNGMPAGVNFVFDAITPLTVNGKNAISIIYADSFARNIRVQLTNTTTAGFFEVTPAATATADMIAGFRTIQRGDIISVNGGTINGFLHVTQEPNSLPSIRCGNNDNTGFNGTQIPIMVNTLGPVEFEISLVRRVTYFLQDMPDEEDSGKTVKWLMRQVNLKPAVELIPGVINLDFDYNIALPGGGTVTSFNVANPTPLQTRDIRMVNVYIENASLLPGADGNYASSSATTSVAVRRYVDTFN